MSCPTDSEQWEPGDIVLAADGGLWCRAADHHVTEGWPWAYAHGYAPQSGITPPPEGSVEESYPKRPLTLLVRNGTPYTERASGDPQDRTRSGPKRSAGRVPCPLCGKPTAIHATGKMFAHSDPKAATGSLPCVGSGLTVEQAVPGLTRSEADEIRYGAVRRQLRR